MDSFYQNLIFEWGPIVTAIICMASGYCHAWICATGSPKKKTIMFLTLVAIIMLCIGLPEKLLEGLPVDKNTFGQFIQRIFLGTLVPMYAGIGIFAWCNPRKWVGFAEFKESRNKMNKPN